MMRFNRILPNILVANEDETLNRPSFETRVGEHGVFNANDTELKRYVYRVATAIRLLRQLADREDVIFINRKFVVHPAHIYTLTHKKTSHGIHRMFE